MYLKISLINIIAAVALSEDISVTIAYEGGELEIVAASAQSTTITDIRWTINGTALSELPDIDYDPGSVNMRLVTLTLRNVSVGLNGGIVGCTAVVTGMNITCSPPRTIQVQGIL